MSITSDGKTIYLPSFEKDHWHVSEFALQRRIGEDRAQIGSTQYDLRPRRQGSVPGRAEVPFAQRGRYVHEKPCRDCGPIQASIRPFTVNGRQSLVFVNVNELLGFEVGDIHSGRKLHRVEVTGFQPGPVKRHGCPSHGIGLTPTKKKSGSAIDHNSRMHVFDATVMPPDRSPASKFASNRAGSRSAWTASTRILRPATLLTLPATRLSRDLPTKREGQCIAKKWSRSSGGAASRYAMGISSIRAHDK